MFATETFTTVTFVEIILIYDFTWFSLCYKKQLRYYINEDDVEKGS